MEKVHGKIQNMGKIYPTLAKEIAVITLFNASVGLAFFLCLTGRYFVHSAARI
jgi:hypothetical protein